MNSVKMTKDPPKGVKANILEIYSNQNSTKQEKLFYNTSDKPAEWKQLYLSLCYFHGVLRERRRYGPVGWNIYYDFNDSDFKISVRQLK
jgi:dynein heavy chain